MSEDIEIAGIQVPQADWEATPPSIQALVTVLVERLSQQSQQISHLHERLSHLEERLNRTSQNSSKPPSADGFGAPAKGPPKGARKRRRSASTTPPRQVRKLKPSEACEQVFEVKPSVC